jgi:hypothetical protein
MGHIGTRATMTVVGTLWWATSPFVARIVSTLGIPAAFTIAFWTIHALQT